jgi:hypothetical protein
MKTIPATDYGAICDEIRPERGSKKPRGPNDTLTEGT